MPRPETGIPDTLDGTEAVVENSPVESAVASPSSIDRGGSTVLHCRE